MSKPFSNKLRITKLEKKEKDDLCSPTVYRLFGSLNGKHIRKQGRDLAALEALKANLLLQHKASAAGLIETRLFERTTLTQAELREAERAFQILRTTGCTRGIDECVRREIATWKKPETQTKG